MKNPENIYYAKNHVEPYRIYLAGKNDTFALIDLQIKAELKDLNDPVKQKHSLSIYLKPPINICYRLYSKDYKLTQPSPGLLNYELITEIDSEYRNPYISWHGTGVVHATAFKDGDLKKSERIVDDREAISWRDVVMRPSLVLRATIPVADLSHATMLPDKPHSLNIMTDTGAIERKDINSIILDQTKLVTDSISVDVFVHNRGYAFKDFNDLPYSNNSEIIWLAPPLMFNNSDSVFAPSVSVFIYQPVNDSQGESERLPLILTGITKQHPTRDIIIQAMIDKK